MKGRSAGYVMVVTLAIMAGLVVLVMGLSANARESVHALENRSETSRARLMAESAIQRAVAEIRRQDPAHATSADDWAQDGQTGNVQFQVGRDSFRYQVLDACASVNVNTAPQAQLAKLPMTSEQVSSLLDWRESGKVARPDGAKDDYYNALSNPYNAKLKPFDSVEELLLVRGFTPEGLYGQQDAGGSSGALSDLLTAESLAEDKSPTGDPKINLQAVTADQLTTWGVPADLANTIVQNASSFTKLGDVLGLPGMTEPAARAILDYLTMAGSGPVPGMINVNTAPEGVIASLPLITPDTAEAVVARQSTGFKSLGELLDVPGMSLTVLAQDVDQLSVSSRSFKVRAIGTAGRVNVAIETTLTLGDDGKVQASRLEPQSFREARVRWGWPETPSSVVNLGGTS